MEAPSSWLLALHHRIRQVCSLALRGWRSAHNRGLPATWKRLRERYLSPGRKLPQVVDSLVFPSIDGPLALPSPPHPAASIVIPVFNRLDLTLGCLHALAACNDATPFEVIVVDDGSSDESGTALPTIPGLRYRRNAANLGFIGACNAGADLARGEFLVFLNNDTTVQPGWLDALLDTFRAHPDTGLAGSALIYPDGRLQEAGGIVFSDGSGWNYGRFEDPSHPRYQHVREVDYCSGAALALRGELFRELGGFDERYAPAYYEDTDLAMRVRRAGWKVRFQPASVVVHHEGGTAGTDVESGVKAYQRVNATRFQARWREVLEGEHAPPGTDPHRAARRRCRARVLVVDADTPTAGKDPGTERMLALMRTLLREGCSVAFIPDTLRYDGDATRALQRLGVEAWWHPAMDSLPDWLRQHGKELHLVVASGRVAAAPMLALLRTHAPSAHLLLDIATSQCQREPGEAQPTDAVSTPIADGRAQAGEPGLIGVADSVWASTPAIADRLAAKAPHASVQVVPNIEESAVAIMHSLLASQGRPSAGSR